MERVALAVGGEVNVGFGGEIEGKRSPGSYGIILKWVERCSVYWVYVTQGVPL